MNSLVGLQAAFFCKDLAAMALKSHCFVMLDRFVHFQTRYSGVTATTHIAFIL